MPSLAELKETIRKKVIELARELSGKAVTISDDELLLERGVLDSASVLELLVWIETQLDIELDQSELSLDNFGSVTLMAEFLIARTAG